MFIPLEQLKHIHNRSFLYDKSNRFPEDDYRDLIQLGYLRAFLPKAYDGFDLSLYELIQEQIHLAYHSPGTALSINMHHIIVGVGRHLVRHQIASGSRILKAAQENKLLAFAISEPSNDQVLFGSISHAKKVSDGYLVSGKKVFVSNAKEADFYLSYAQDNQDPSNPKSVFFFIKTDQEGIQIDNDWDTIGMKATQSQTVIFNDLYVKETDVLAVISPRDFKHPILLGIFAYFELLLAATYHGIGKRALDLGIAYTQKRFSVSNQTTYSNDKDIRWRIAEAAIILDGIESQLETLSNRFEKGAEDSFWLPKLSTIKNKSVEATKKALDEIIRACGGASYYTKNELSKLYRDALAGIFQPSDQESLHGAWANMLLGVIR